MKPTKQELQKHILLLSETVSKLKSRIDKAENNINSLKFAVKNKPEYSVGEIVNGNIITDCMVCLDGYEFHWEYCYTNTKTGNTGVVITFDKHIK